MEQDQPSRVGRRLAAIVAADVAGYSRLMGLDEVGTARTLREHRKLMKAATRGPLPAAEQTRGRGGRDFCL
jgi:class 3 adenylate cyclase